MVDEWLMRKKINTIVNAENLYNNLHVTALAFCILVTFFIKF